MRRSTGERLKDLNFFSQTNIIKITQTLKRIQQLFVRFNYFNLKSMTEKPLLSLKYIAHTM